MGMLNPSMYPSAGLLQARFDASGGGKLEKTVGGDTPALFAVVSGNQVTIPASSGGGDVSFVRAVWNLGVNTRWAGFMADLDPSLTLPAAANLLAAANSDINTWTLGAGALFDTGITGGAVTSATIAAPGNGYAVGNIVPINGGNNDAYVTVTSVDAAGGITGVGTIVGGSGYAAALSATTNPVVNLPGETRITLAQPVADGTGVQIFYIYRDGSVTLAGQALSGYPDLHLAEQAIDYGTANDGDNYSAAALYHAYATFNIQACKDLADRILDAQLSAGLAAQAYTFDLSLAAEEQAGGLFNYYNYTTLDWSVKALPDGTGQNGLNVKTAIGAGGPPYPSAGWGSWIAYPISAVSPFNGFSFDFCGDGTDNRITLSVNIHDPSDSAGEYVYGYACLAADKNVRRSFALAPADFWQLANVVLNADRSNTYSGAFSSDGLATVADVAKDALGASGFHQFLAKRFAFFLSTETYAGCYFGSNDSGFASAGTTNLKIDLESSFAGNVTVTITDANGATYPYVYAAVAGQQLFDVPYTSFTNGASIVHPIKQVQFQPGVAVDGTLDIDNIRCSTASSDIVNLAGATYSVLNGWQFDFSSGTYDVYWKNVAVSRPAVNPYPGVSRWNYAWAKFAGFYGRGSYRGAMAAGYQWMLGYTLSGKTYPAGTVALLSDGSTIDLSGTQVVARIRQFLKDAQDAYAAQYPAQTPGPFMKKYGVDSWEHVKGAGYIGGALVPNATYPEGVLDQFFCEGKDDWYGYQYRAMLSTAQDYFATGDATSKSILDTVMAWVAAKCTWNSANNTVTVPTTFNVDGTLASASNIYAEACLAQICIYKYWRDGDATALAWYERFLADLHYNQKKTATGTLRGVFPKATGSGFTAAQVSFTVNAGATAPVVTPIIAGGRIVRYAVEQAGANITSISAAVTGDGSGAIATPYLDDALVGAYNVEHTGWEASEILNTLSLLIVGRKWGTVNFAIVNPPAWIGQDYADLLAFYDRNTADARPSMLTSMLEPMHEYTWSSWHSGVSVEDPRYQDTHTDGDIWTETIGPSMFAAVDRYLVDGNRRWLRNMLALLQSMAGADVTSIVLPVDQARLDEQAKFSRNRALVLKTELNWCQNTFGVAPCTATGTPCYQTYYSCKDQPHFTNGTRTRSYCNRGLDMPLGEDMRPYVDLSSFQPSPTEIPLIGGLARRSNITIKLFDEVCPDEGEDPYITTRATPAQGTYWTRFLARNPYYGGRQAIVSHGYRTEPFDWKVFQDELYQIPSISGPDENDMITIELTDIAKSLDNNQIPAPSAGTLVADLKATEYSGAVISATADTVTLSGNASPVDGYYVDMEVYITVGSGSGERRKVYGYVGATRTATLTNAWQVQPDAGSVAEVAALSLSLPLGSGAQYNDPAQTGREERVRIGDEEIRYTSLNGDVLSWTDNSCRAAGGTARADHKTGDGVQQCWVASDEAYSDVVRRLFNDGGMADQYLDLVMLQNLDDIWLGAFMRIARSVNVPTKASDLLNQILLVGGLYSWWDPVAQMQKFAADMPQLSGTVPSITADNIVAKSVKKETLDAARITDFAIIYNPVSAVANTAELKNFLNPDVVEDTAAVSSLEYGARVMQRLYTSWLTSANSIYAHVFAKRVLRRLRDVPLKLSFSLDPRDERQLAEVIDVTHRKVTDLTGAPATVRMRVTKITANGNQDVVAVSTSLSPRDAIIAPDGTADYPADATYGHISDLNSLMPDGTGGYLIV